jgi:type IV secretory pathway VirB9-like protein
MDIVLEPGEELRNLVGGDRSPVEAQETPPWQLKEGVSGTGPDATPHVFVTATKPGMTMGLIITTSHRTYYLTCKSVAKSPIRAIRWQHPPQPVPVRPRPKPVWPDPVVTQQYHIGYHLTAIKGEPDWMPQWVGDDGKKLYLILPVTSLYEVAPLIRGVGANGPFLVNMRQYRNVLIVDQLLAHAELRVGVGETAEVVTITRGALSTITCPGTPACPQWPPWGIQQGRRE